MKLRFVDCECFTHWWAIIYCDMPDNPDDITTDYVYSHRVIIQSSDDNARDKAMQALYEQDVCLVGYNIKHYDLIIFNAIFEGFSPEQVHIINDLIINPHSYSIGIIEYRRLYGFSKKLLPNSVYQDLMDDSNKDMSLKEKEAILGLDIYESNVPFDKEDLTEEDIADLLKYCTYDVFATMYYYEHISKAYVTTKLVVAKTFNMSEADGYRCTNATLSGRALQAKKQSFSDADQIDIELPDKIKQYVYDNIPENVIEYLLHSNMAYEVKLFNNIVDFGDGGLHSVYANDVYIEEDSEYMLMNNDAASFYPNSMLSFDCLSRAVPDPSLFRGILDRRMVIKNKENRTYDEYLEQLAYKLILNTTYGAASNQYLALYDPYMRSKLCRIDQLFLAALASKMTKEVPGLIVVQTNTDATMLYFPRKYKDKVMALAQEWTDISDIPMEQDYIHRIWQKNVNNYLIEMCSGKIKHKGAWLSDTESMNAANNSNGLRPLDAYVCSKAIQQYLLYDKSAIEYIVRNDNFKDYIITCKKGSSFRGVVQRMSDGREIELTKCNRVVPTKDTQYGMLYKYKVIKTENGTKIQYNQMPDIPEHCLLLNKDLSTYDLNEIKKQIDYMYYIMRVANTLDVKWRQAVGNELFPTDRFDYHE